MDSPGFISLQGRDFALLHNAQTGSGIHPVYYSAKKVSFSRKSAVFTVALLINYFCIQTFSLVYNAFACRVPTILLLSL
jgi:hypothetical protein